MREGSLFTGYGGLGMAASTVLGTRPAWFVDNDPGASRLLEYRYPGVPNHGDITRVDWSAVEPVDVLTGGFPCQDISNAGKRAGIEGGRSGLWSYFADAIRVLRPRYVLIENVAALVVRGLDRVLADLAPLGFDAEWTTVRASDVGAPHRRERVFIAARDTTDSTSQDADLKGRGLCTLAPADSQGDGWHEGRTEPAGLVGGSDAAERGAPAADADCGGRRRNQGDTGRGEVDRAPADGDRAGGVDWEAYEPAVRRWEAILGRPASEPTVVGTRGGRVLNSALPEWMMGLPDGWITAVPGLSRNEQLRLAGNGVCPQQAAAAFSHLLPLLEDARRTA